MVLFVITRYKIDDNTGPYVFLLFLFKSNGVKYQKLNQDRSFARERCNDGLVVLEIVCDRHSNSQHEWWYGHVVDQFTCKFNCHTITTTMPPLSLRIKYQVKLATKTWIQEKRYKYDFRDSTNNITQWCFRHVVCGFLCFELFSRNRILASWWEIYSNYMCETLDMIYLSGIKQFHYLFHTCLFHSHQDTWNILRHYFLIYY